MRRKFIFLIVALFFTLVLSKATNPEKICGVWLTQDKDSKVQIFKRNDKFFGKVIWLRDSLKNGVPVKDNKNPNVKLKLRSIIGLTLLNGLKFDDGEWEDGEIYDPKKGKTYDCIAWINPEDESILHIKGYIGFSLIGREVKWTRIGK